MEETIDLKQVLMKVIMETDPMVTADFILKHNNIFSVDGKSLTEDELKLVKNFVRYIRSSN